VTRLSGDVCQVVQPGANRQIVWNAGVDWPEHKVTDAKARVTAWSTNAPPQVMVIDLSKGTAASESDPYPVYYYTSLAALPSGGLSNDVYKTEMLVMNKIPMGTFSMGIEETGGPSVSVTLTNDFYAGVYQVTQKQWNKVMAADPSGFKDPVNPVENVSYNDIRGSVAGAGWPANDSVDASSFLGKLRDKTGLPRFDLPTEAQWEYACRAGTITYFNDGISGSSTNQLNELGWWSGNSESKTHPVGRKTPNTWGLYDMHGNVWEWCLDWYDDTLMGGFDPKGPAESGSTRVNRGGRWGDHASSCRSASRLFRSPPSRDNNRGFRLVRTITQ